MSYEPATLPPNFNPNLPYQGPEGVYFPNMGWSNPANTTSDSFQEQVPALARPNSPPPPSVPVPNPNPMARPTGTSPAANLPMGGPYNPAIPRPTGPVMGAPVPGGPMPTTQPGSGGMQIKTMIGQNPYMDQARTNGPMGPGANPSAPMSSSYPSPNPNVRQSGPSGGYPGMQTNDFQFDPNGFGSAGRFQLDPAVEQAFRFALQQAMARYQDPSANSYYSGRTVAGLTPDEQRAADMVRGNVSGMQGMVGNVGDYYSSLMSQPGQPNPQLESAIGAMRRNAMTGFMDPSGPMKSIRDDAMAGGAYGGTRQGIAEGIAMGRLGDSLTSNEANMRYSDLGAQYQRASGAAAALPSYLQSMMYPASALSSVGAQSRDLDQQQISSDMQRWAYETSMPDTRLQNLLNMINGTMPIGGTNYSQTYQPSWYQDILRSAGGAAGGSGSNPAAIAAALAGLYKMFGN